jgi:ATP adenylyltransferase
MKNKNLWAPWRIEYLKSLGAKESQQEQQGEGCEGEGCFLCQYWNDPEQDKANLVLWRTKLCLVVFNRFPYTAGHLLVAPGRHVGEMHGLDDGVLLEMMLLARDGQSVLAEAIRPHGFNIGININRCAGAGLPDHIHLHLVPRWQGDTNFMDVTGHVRLISQELDELYKELREISRRLKLPSIKE